MPSFLKTASEDMETSEAAEIIEGSRHEVGGSKDASDDHSSNYFQPWEERVLPPSAKSSSNRACVGKQSM